MAIQKAYQRINWENLPSEKTPIDEINLNKMDKAIDDLDDRIVALDAAVSSGSSGSSGLSSNIIKSYIVGDVPYNNKWLSLENNGSALIPNVNAIYLVVTPGEYARKTFMWNGNQYDQIADKVNQYNRNEVVTYNISGSLSNWKIFAKHYIDSSTTKIAIDFLGFTVKQTSNFEFYVSASDVNYTSADSNVTYAQNGNNPVSLNDSVKYPTHDQSMITLVSSGYQYNNKYAPNRNDSSYNPSFIWEFDPRSIASPTGNGTISLVGKWFYIWGYAHSSYNQSFVNGSYMKVYKEGEQVITENFVAKSEWTPSRSGLIPAATDQVGNAGIFMSDGKWHTIAELKTMLGIG